MGRPDDLRAAEGPSRSARTPAASGTRRTRRRARPARRARAPRRSRRRASRAPPRSRPRRRRARPRPCASHCQTCEREISDVAASSIRLKIATAPEPCSQAARYWIPTETLLCRPSIVISPGVEATSSRSAAVESTSSRCRSTWFGRSPRTRSKISIATGTRSGCATQVPSKPWPASRSLSSRTFASAAAFTSAIAAGGDEGGHAAHRVRAARVAGLDEQLRVGAHERDGHRHGRAVGEHELLPVPELLDHAEDVVPAARVQAGRVLAQLVEDLVHLERGEDRLDQDGRLDRPLRHAEPLLRPDEDVVPEPRLQVRLELRQVEPRAAAVVVAEEVEAEVEQARRHRRAVDLEVPLLQVPAARPHEQGRRLLVQAVLLLAGVELDRAVERVRQVDLALDAVLPGRRVRVLEVGHEHLRARVERVDHHLPVDRAGDLDAAVLQLGRDRRDAPVALADLLRLGEEVGQLAVAQPLRPLVPRVEQLAAPRAEPAARAR